MSNSRRPLRIGIVGLGNAARMILPHLASSELVELAGAADTRVEARERFTSTYSQPAFETVEELARSNVDVIWVATPNEFHAKHVVVAADAGRHVVCEKPMALSLTDCDRMIAAADRTGVKFMLGHSKLKQAPILKMREIIAEGSLGNVIQISTWNYNDWLQRPRLEAEVDTDQGGGICYRQAPHQIDIVRYLAGRPARSIRSVANRADPGFRTEGNYSALVEFDGNLAANLVYNAYGYFDVTELSWGIGEGGDIRDIANPRPPTPRLTGPVQGGVRYGQAAANQGADKKERRQPFYGLTIVSCEYGTIRQSPDGLYIYDRNGRREIVCDREPPIRKDLVELVSAISDDRAPFPDGHWGKATLEVCLGLLESSRSRTEVMLHHQGTAFSEG
jgi:phthalate 4,5-cis-dihydrodiol dehydrogenase